MERKVNVLGWASIVLGILGAGAGIYVVVTGFQMLAEAERLSHTSAQADPCTALMSIIIVPLFGAAGPFVVAYGTLTIVTHVLMGIAGWGLLKRRTWARTAGILASILFLVTGGGVIGILYSVPALIVLTQPQCRAMFSATPGPWVDPPSTSPDTAG